MPPKRPKPKPLHHGRGIIRPTPQHTWLAEIHHGNRRYRKRLKTRQEARNWLDAQEYAFRAQDGAALSALDLQDAAKARSLLPPAITLSEAVTHYLRQFRVQQSLSSDQAVAKFLADKERAGLRPRSLASLHSVLKHFAAAFPGPLEHITAPAMLEWFRAMDGSNITRDNRRRALSGFFNWAVRAGYAVINPLDAVSKPRSDAAPPGFLSIEQTKALLAAALEHDPGLCAYIALGLFAGIRRSELDALRWDDLKKDYIHIPARIAKARQQRFITYAPNLKPWLERARPSHSIPSPLGRGVRGEGVLIATNARKRLDALRAHAGLTDAWPSNALRHSFATYHLAAYQDAGKTAHEMGHQSPAMLFKHYRQLVEKKEGKAWFALKPSNFSLKLL